MYYRTNIHIVCVYPFDWCFSFSQWCGHCKTFKPVFDALSARVKEEQLPLTLARVNCVDDGRVTCRRFEVKAFPTLLYNSKENVYQYNNARTADTLLPFVTEGYQKVEPKVAPAEVISL